MVLLSQCTETCGWFAAILAAATWGSFGVPIKGERSTSCNVDPLVMQSYKVIMCFATCWLVVPLLGQPVGFTPWGIASGLFWVPGATAGIYGIRNAGLAISVGTWSSLIVVSSFFWGIGVFREDVKSVPGAFCAMLLLCAGLGGMSRYSHPPPPSKSKSKSKSKQPKQAMDVEEELLVPLNSLVRDSLEEDGSIIKSSSSAEAVPVHVPVSGPLHGKALAPPAEQPDRGVAKRKRAVAAAPQSTDGPSSASRSSPSLERSASTTVDSKGHAVPELQSQTSTIGCTAPLEMDDATIRSKSSSPEGGEKESTTIVLFNGRVAMTRRQLGILGAVVNGVWGGTSLIPLHYAKAQGYGGAAYVISFACGSLLVLIVAWVLRYLFNMHRFGCCHRDAYGALPSFHLRQMWLPGLLSGTLYSIGNFASIIATTYLGQGVGYSICQSALLVSGMWGIFWFGEIKGAESIMAWFGCASVTLVAIVWLSYEHKGDAVH